jgi:hypothetical protein
MSVSIMGSPNIIDVRGIVVVVRNVLIVYDILAEERVRANGGKLDD